MKRLKHRGKRLLAIGIVVQFLFSSGAAFVTDAADISDIPIVEYTFDKNDSFIISTPEGGEQTESNTPTELLRASEMPQEYSLLDVDGECYVTSVKDQEKTGLCWAYAAIGACESSILLQGLSIPDECRNNEGELDLSEAGLAWYAYTDHNQIGDETSGEYIEMEGDKGKDGGNLEIAAAAFAAGIGTQSQRYLSLDDWDDGYSEYQRFASYYDLKNSYTLLYAESGYESTIKSWIMEVGAVSFAYYSRTSNHYDNGTSIAYYQTSHDVSDINHAALIVGWDDNYSRENFSEDACPSEDGAWLVRGSWGTDSANTYDGYYWISYEEPSLSSFECYEMAEKQGDEILYQYDSMPTALGLATSSVANVFTAQQSGTLTSVMFPNSEINPENLKYEISIYRLKDGATSPTNGTLLSTCTGTISGYGYKSVALTDPVPIEMGEKFSVVLSLSATNSRRNSSIYFSTENDNDFDVLAYHSTIDRGESYIAISKNSWMDVVDYQAYTNYNVGNVLLKVTEVTDEELSPNWAQWDHALSFGTPDQNDNPLYQTAYADAITLSDDASQWEINAASLNLLAGLERAGLLIYPQYLYTNLTYLRGDSNLDGRVDSEDAYDVLVTYSAESLGISQSIIPTQVAAGDVDESGDLSPIDSHFILRYYANNSLTNTADWSSILQT